MTGTSFQHAKRGSMSPQRIARIFQANGGRCHACHRKLGPSDDYAIDHKIALENGGTDDDDNCAPICDWCHDTEKTPEDHAQAAKGKRMATKHVVPRRHKQSRWRR